MTLALGMVPLTLRADALERIFIMPGPVIGAHAEIESDCDSCHAPLSDTPQNQLCVACHEDIGADVERERGFHGRDPEASTAECASCHTDHEGRDAQVVLFDADSFDHRFTDFPLLGGHGDATCDACHVEDALFRDAPSECIVCHRDDDHHDGALGEACGDCHNASDWRFVRFDHAKTGFALTGGHKSATCEACHTTADYAATPTECVACHRQEDVHKGRNGTECGDCHVTANWQQLTFNHAKETGFALRGGHDGLTCQDCHRADDFSGLRGDDCNSCHVNDDVHKGRNGPDCAACHGVSSWVVSSFDHTAISDFALVDTHATLECQACHVNNVQDKLPRDCGGCHGESDPHKGQLGARCEDCHAQVTWTASVRFDHDLTSFPLIGMHGELACDECHATPAYHDAPMECKECHAEDDPHGGTLGPMCEVCHNPRDWQAWVFDHQKQTDFALTGSHATVPCGACHQTVVSSLDEVSAPRDCAGCHRRDDPHQGRFGDACGSCHTTESFRQIREL